MVVVQVKFLENVTHLQRILTLKSYLQHEMRRPIFFLKLFQFLNGFIFVVGLFFLVMVMCFVWFSVKVKLGLRNCSLFLMLKSQSFKLLFIRWSGEKKQNRIAKLLITLWESNVV